jgi:hypothetical protein
MDKEVKFRVYKNVWITWCKRWAHSHNLTLRKAMQDKECKSEYQRLKKTGEPYAISSEMYNII